MVGGRGPETPALSLAWSKDHFDIYYGHIKGSLRLRMVAWKTSEPLASARLEVGVRKHQHEVWLGQRIILVYNMSV